MKKNRVRLGIMAIAAVMVIGSGCDWIPTTTTKERMTGVWQVTGAWDENGVSLLSAISFPVAVIHLADANSVNSTAGPLFMNIVYGSSNYTQIASQVDQVFNYASLDLTEGEWFIEGGFPDRFTIEMKLQGLPGQSSLTTLLNALGIAQNYLDVTVYHKFMDVEVTFEAGSEDSVMVWKFDDQTTAVYNKKDSYGNYVVWGGWPVTSFGRYTLEFTKRVKTVRQIIQEN
ncbi:MAG: hypothetical protein JW699_07795 [Chitinispirillaceae bacterium]|nr:hypothetical protein [Chitinispirillaceae bacterium]